MSKPIIGIERGEYDDRIRRVQTEWNVKYRRK